MRKPIVLSDHVLLRRARTEDTSALEVLVRAYYKFDGIPFDLSIIRPALNQLLLNRELGQAWLLEHRAHAIGYALVTFGFDLEFGGRQATLTDLFIRSRHRGKGLGLAVLSHLERRLANSGLCAVELQVLRSNKRASAFYRRAGFTAHSRIPMSKIINQRSGSLLAPRESSV